MPSRRLTLSIEIEPFGLPAALVVLAGLFAGAWAGTHLLRGHDLLAYWDAAGRLLDGGRLYTTAEMAGPISPFTPLGYLYPPTLAFLLAPVRALGVGFETAGVGWDALQAGALVFAALLALRAGGARSIGLPVVVALVSAPVWWYPERSLLADGNVGGLLALCLALALQPGAVGGAAVGLATLLKVTPAAALPAVLLGSRRGLVGALAVLALGALICFVTAPADTLAVPTVLANLAAGGTGGRFDFGPGATLALLGGAGGAAIGRALGLLTLVGLSAVGVSAARGGRHRIAIVAGIWATLFVSGTIWIHYLVVAVVPIGVAWPRATRFQRGVIVAALASSWSILLPEAAARVTFWAAVGVLVAITLRAAARLELGPDPGRASAD